jgi:PAS domain S-box-containing protein
LLQNHLVPAKAIEDCNALNEPCWRALACPKVLCPAYGKPPSECWLVPRTHCSNQLEEDFFLKLSSCLSCAYFRTLARVHPTGWNRFIADQMRRYNTKALEHLYQKEESFIEILNRIPDGLFTTDQDLRITYFNPAAEKITGFLAQDAVGMYCKDVFKNPLCVCDCALKRAVAEERDVHNREYVITDIDGRKVPIICSTSPFRDASGRITGGLEIFKDVTELRRLQEEIVRREKKYRRIFEGSNDMIYTSNLQGRLLDVNQAGVEMLGYLDKAELLKIGSTERFYRSAKDRKRFLKHINQEGYVRDFEVDFLRRNGSSIRTLISSRRYENPETGDIELEGIIKDITHRKRAEEETHQRNRELSLLNRIAMALSHNLGLSHVLPDTLNDVLSLLGLKRGAIILIDRAEKVPRVEARRGLPEHDAGDSVRMVFKDQLLKKCLLEGDVLLKPEPTFPPFRVRYRGGNGRFTAWLTCFLITSQGKGVGFFALDMPRRRELKQQETNLMGSLGNFLGSAIESAQLMETIRRHRQDLKRLTEKLFASQEEERRRIARELHDEAGQSLTAVKLALERLEAQVGRSNHRVKAQIGDIHSMIRRTSDEIRRLSYHLHPTLLIDLGLEPALNLYFKEIRKNAGILIDFHMVGFDQRLAVDIETVFYRFSQEALTNTLKYAGAEHFRLSIIKSYPRIIFLAEDDGCGFDTAVIDQDKRSLGLLGMRERAHLLGGSFQLRSKPEEGTRIRIEIPYIEADPHEKFHPNPDIR